MDGDPGEGDGKEHTVPAFKAVAPVRYGYHANEGSTSYLREFYRPLFHFMAWSTGAVDGDCGDRPCLHGADESSQSFAPALF